MSTCFGFVSTYPPTQCGLATFSASLRDALVSHGRAEGRVIRSVETPQPRPSAEVVAQLVMGDRASLIGSATQLNDCDVAIIQHEFGIFGGVDGDEVLPLLEALEIPTIVVLHTVLVEPTQHQRDIIEAIVAAADAIVTVTARDRLLAGYAVDMGKVSIIAHGAAGAPASGARAIPTFRNGQSTVLTWGLLGPGKGIEWGIEAMALLADAGPLPRYVVAGQTHPKVLLHEGEAYRDALTARVSRLGLQASVSFDPHYRDAASLAQLVSTADIVLLPYDSTDQVTSGVLIEAVAAGKPVVATGFPHACELLGDGAGLVVAHRDPAAIADALRTLITRRDVADRMARKAAAAAPQLLWPAVAEQYRELASRLISASVAA